MPKQDEEKNIWNKASGHFNTHKKAEQIEDIATENILIGWPPILDFIANNISNPKGVNALDFGCGAGGFAQKLYDLGFNVTGIDYSEKMIDIAKNHCDKRISFIVGGLTKIPNQKFKIISSIMVLQFIQNIEKAFQSFSNSLEKGGLLTFAVFKPEWVKSCLQEKQQFVDFDSIETPTKGAMLLDGNEKVQVFIRNSNKYDRLAAVHGFIKVMENYPPFTQEFLDKYKPTIPTTTSEYLIMGFRKD